MVENKITQAFLKQILSLHHRGQISFSRMVEILNDPPKNSFVYKGVDGKMKIVYIVHPISGDVKGNIDKILNIVRSINMSYPEVVPFAPYIVDCLAMDDDIPEERARGIKNDIAFFENGTIDELWLFGDKISSGMQHEIELAKKLGIPIISQSSGTISF